MASPWTICSTLALVLAASRLAADPFPDHRWTLRANLGINTPTDPLPGRFARAAVVSLSIGYESALSTSRRPFEASDCLHSSPCPPYFKAGSGQVSARWGLGFTF